jgi:hypothetical protein
MSCITTFTENHKCGKIREKEGKMSGQHHAHSRMTIDMPFEEHKKLKAMAAFMGVSLKDLVLNCLRDNLLSNIEPNDETLKAFRETDERKGLVRCKDFNDFIDKLGLE